MELIGSELLRAGTRIGIAAAPLSRSLLTLRGITRHEKLAKHYAGKGHANNTSCPVDGLENIWVSRS